MPHGQRTTRRKFVTQLGTIVGAASGVLPITSSSLATAQALVLGGRRAGFLERPGGQVFYEVSGSGPALIFAHGNGGNYLSWWQQVPHFAADLPA
jgi:hypothetical protein